MKVPLFYYVFDLLSLAGQDTRLLPLRERKRLLETKLHFTGPLRLSEYRVAKGEAFYTEACRRGWEGLIAKRAASLYTPGRSRDWLKLKCVNQQEFAIVGYTDPPGSRQGFGALLVGYWSRGTLIYAGKAGTGTATIYCASSRESWPHSQARTGLRGGLHGMDRRRKTSPPAFSRFA